MSVCFQSLSILYVSHTYGLETEPLCTEGALYTLYFHFMLYCVCGFD